MMLQTIFLFTTLASTMAHPHVHPHAPRHGRRKLPSGSGGAAAPTGGMYGMGNSSFAYASTGSGFATGMVASTNLPVESAGGDVQLSPSKMSDCDAGNRPTFTVYETDRVTMTLTVDDGAIQSTGQLNTSIPSSSGSSSNVTVADGVLAGPTSAVASDSQSTSERARVPGASVPASGSDVPGAKSSVITAEPISPSPTSSSAGKSSQSSQGSAVESDSATSSSKTDKSYGAFYEVPGGKRGLAYNSAKLTNAFTGTQMSWAYNWAPNPSGDLDRSIEYVPMLWGPKTYDGWEKAADDSVASGSTHMLSFNEPDLPAQANMDTATAAADHIKYMNPYSGKVRIGSPAVTNGGPEGGSDGLGLGWMEKFLDNCDGQCKLDFLVFHWYDSADNVAYFKKHVQEVIDLGKKHGINKVWLTEFAAAGSDEEVEKFLDDVMPWMDSNDAVERYAYFMCADGQLLSGGALSPVGKAYAA